VWPDYSSTGRNVPYVELLRALRKFQHLRVVLVTFAALAGLRIYGKTIVFEVFPDIHYITSMPTRDQITRNLHSKIPYRWEISPGLTPYPEALATMDAEVAAIAEGAPELIWLLEHPPIYTAGTSAKSADLVDPTRFPVFEIGRGGQYTYHGPGQRICYVMMDLKKRGADVRAFVAGLEDVIIRTLSEFGIIGGRREDRVGVWVQRGQREDKIAALGIRVRRGVTLHGLSINLNPDLSHFSGIVPCGVTEHGVTSFTDLGVNASMAALDSNLQKNFAKIFGAPSK
jgi:lipoyl(octanoyl) transferase